MKICTRCKEDKPISEFYKHKAGKNGIAASCKDCSKKSIRENYEKNKIRINKYNREYHSKNRASIILVQAAYRKDNKISIAARNAEWRSENKESLKASRAEYYKENSEILKEESKRRYKESPDRRKSDRSRNIERYKHNERAQGKRKYQKLKNCENYKASCAARGMLHRVIGITKTGKKEKTETALGYSFDSFKKHIEMQFDDTMSWDNHGAVWHVDHIVPVMTLIAAGITDPKRVNALDNLRPLCAHENMSKGDRFVLEPKEYSRAFKV
jgi:hypothetical protein